MLKKKLISLIEGMPILADKKQNNKNYTLSIKYKIIHFYFMKMFFIIIISLI